MRQIKRSGFTTLECVISLFIVSMIVFLITSTLHNNMILLRKNHDNRRMLYIAREIIEDKRNHIKNSNDIEAYNNENIINNLKVRTLITPISNNCCSLKVNVSNNNNEVELNTHVTKKK